MTRATCLLVTFFLAATAVPAAAAQGGEPWYRSARLERSYNLAGVRILVIVAPRFNEEETVGIPECWKRWGAHVEFAGPARVLTGEVEGVAPGSAAAPAPTLRVDHLLSEADPSRYDVLYVAGGEGIPQLLADHRGALARLIDGVHARGKILTAICHGPMALAASGSVKGRRLTVQGTAQSQALREAGAVLANEIAVVDGSLVTAQWPHLEEFAVTVAERVQYPGGGGPREKALAARNPAERLVDDLRETVAFEATPVPPQAVDVLARGAQRALATRTSRGARAMRFVAVQQSSTKAELSAGLFERSKDAFVALGVPEAVVRTQVGRAIEGAPLLLFQFVEAPAGLPAEAAERLLRADLAYAGAAAANLALVTRSLGLGVSMIGMQPLLAAEAEVRRILQVPDNQLLVGIFGIGYPAVSGVPAVARPAAEVVFGERWNGGGAKR